MVEDAVFFVVMIAVMTTGVAIAMWIADVGPLASKNVKDHRRRVAKTKELVGEPKDMVGNKFCEMIYNAYKHAGYHMEENTPSQMFLVEKDGKKTVVGINNGGLTRNTMMSAEDGMRRHECTGAIFCKTLSVWHVEVGLQELYNLGIKLRYGHMLLPWLCTIYFPAGNQKQKDVNH